MSTAIAAGGRMRWRTALRLATVGGRADRMRITLTAVGAFCAAGCLLSAETVAATTAADGPYAPAVLDQPGLHIGVVVVLCLMCVPLLVFAGQCGRIGAPARDRRLAALRMAGATPRDVVRVVATESALAAGIGTVAATVAYFVLRAVLDPAIVPPQGRALPTNVLPSTPAVAAVLVGLPVAAGVASALALRRVVVDPFVALAAGAAIGAASLLVACADGIVERRRTFAALVATGTPRSVLARAALAEILLPLTPVCLLAAAVGIGVPRGMLGTTVSPSFTYNPEGLTPPAPAAVAVPVPWTQLGILVGGALVLTLLLTAASLVLLRSATDIGELRAAA